MTATTRSMDDEMRMKEDGTRRDGISAKEGKAEER